MTLSSSLPIKYAWSFMEISTEPELDGTRFSAASAACQILRTLAVLSLQIKIQASAAPSC